MDSDMVASTNKNADHCVREALVHGIYTMIVTATQLTDGSVLRMKAACHASMKKHGATNLAVTARKCKSTVTPKERGVALIVYDKTKTNPYLKYHFLDKTIIVRDNRRAMEQTVQLIYDAVEHRKELNDLIIHTCVTQQHNKRKYLIIMCRGVDSYVRTFFKNGKKIPVHDNNPPVDSPERVLYDKYMSRHLLKYGNTVADQRFIRKYGAAKTEKILSKAVGQRVLLRRVVDYTGEYYIAETESYLRRNRRNNG